jgi:hypothetical protein
MADNAQPVPGGALCTAVRDLSCALELCICVGLAELDRGIVYNSMVVFDRGEYLGCQRKIYLSGDEYVYFGAGEDLALFDIGDLRFGIVICYDNHFPELALLHSLRHVDLILAPHAARTGVWPEIVTPEFCERTISASRKNGPRSTAPGRTITTSMSCSTMLWDLLLRIWRV